MNRRQELMRLLAECWNLYLATNPESQDDIDDFRKGIHDLQRLVACNELEQEQPQFFGK